MSRLLAANNVSIPFKRESTFKLEMSGIIEEGAIVSIPFKRESTFKRVKEWNENRKAKAEVSIPFKRESTFKLLWLRPTETP